VLETVIKSQLYSEAGDGQVHRWVRYVPDKRAGVLETVIKSQLYSEAGHGEIYALVQQAARFAHKGP
jgi:hypothetical protein